jgi:Uma2 family endonuclease
MSIVLNERQRPEPDVAVIDAAVVDDDATWFPAEAVLLAVEVVSPESQIRDRERKPQLYAQAGIEHFWRVETKDGKPVVYVYELDPATRAYALSGIHHERLVLTVPFPIDIDLATG